eukprot:Em0723g1a
MGIYTWPDGSKYTGPFVHNKLLGTGSSQTPQIGCGVDWFTGKVADGRFPNTCPAQFVALESMTSPQ